MICGNQQQQPCQKQHDLTQTSNNNSNIYYNCTQKAIEKNNNQQPQQSSNNNVPVSRTNRTKTYANKRSVLLSNKSVKSQTKLLNSTNRSQMKSNYCVENDQQYVHHNLQQPKNSTPKKDEVIDSSRNLLKSLNY